MSYFAPYIDGAGLHLPTYADRLEDLCSAYRSIFGPDAALTPAVPDYQLLSVFAKSLDDVSALLLSVYNSRNPAYASGQALDLLAPLYGIARRGATCSEVTLLLSGDPGTEIPAGAPAADARGRIWELTASVTLPASGSAQVLARCASPGPLYAGPDTVARILQPVAGWTSVTNPAESTVGLPQETDARLRARMRSAFPSRGACASDNILSAVHALPNVTHAALYINDTDATDDRSIPAHSLALLALGGSPDEIRRALFDKKAPGIGTSGSLSGTVTDAWGVSHTVAFSRPASRAVSLTLSLTPLAGYDAAETAAVLKPALAEAVNSLAIGESLVVPSLYGVCYAAAGDLIRTFAIRSISVKPVTGGTPETEYFSAAWNQRIALNQAMITLSAP